MKQRILTAILSGVLMVTGIVGCSNIATSSDTGNETSSAVSSAEESKDNNSGNNDNDNEIVIDNTLGAVEFSKNLMPGWNLGNQLEANANKVPSETAWGNPTITEDIFKMVKDAGFKSVRIPVSYLSKIGEGPEYTIDSEWLDRVQQVVDMCLDNGLFAIINVHGDGYHSVGGGWLLCDAEDQDTIKAKYEKLWTQVAERFKDYDERLIFESMNEVFNGKYEGIDSAAYANVNAYNQIFVDTVRKAGSKNTTRYLLVPGWNTDIDSTVEGTDFKLPTDSEKNRLLVSVHYYTPYEFCLKESAKGIFKWGVNATEKSIRRNNEDYVDSQFDKLYDSFISKGVGVIIGEYGAIDKSYNDERSTVYRAYFCEYVNYAAAKRDIVTVYWDNGFNGKNGFGIFDRFTMTQTEPEIIEAIMRGCKADYEITAPTV